MKRTLALAALCLSLGSAALAQTVSPAPTLLNYQGRIATPNGNPVPDPSSTLPYSIRLSLWDAATGGNKKWEQVITVQTRNGVFSALLDLSVGGTNGIPADQILAGNVWMETKIGNDATLTPRQQIVSVAYALKANTVPDNAITTSKIADGSITAAKLAAGVIGSATGAAGGDLTGTYPNPAIANNVITSSKLVDGSVLSAKLADLAVTAAKIANDAITTAKLSNNAVTAEKLADLAVLAAKLADNAVTTAKIADNSVTNAKIANNAVNSAKLFSDAASLSRVSGGAMTANGAKINISQPLTVNGLIESLTGGFKFPDGTTQTTAAPADNQRIVYGTVEPDGSIVSGTGFTVQQVSEGVYLINFTQPYASLPTVTATQSDGPNPNLYTGSILDNAKIIRMTSSQIGIATGEGRGAPSNRRFCFIAIGPR